MQVLDAVWEEGDFRGRRVLDVGCGTGRLASELASRGAKVWGVDPSPEMLALARKRVDRRVGLRQGGAETLPFRDGWFERAVLWLSIHLVERPRALAELHRILAPGGRVVIVTFRPEHFERIWLTRYFPSLTRIDQARFVAPAELETELVAAGFVSVRTRALTQAATVKRDEALEKLRGRYISTLWLLDEDEYRAGLELAERELPAETSYPRDWAIIVAERRCP
jgi:ubiquinone/menaquinone biosynthesis C-methylase UbiE